ncbi:hypothetical protein ACIQU6_42980 [Streptomyces sp. NPDC090442]|uniref:hypothetical protein n=1 Tax=Streptomyces sp. NPDC090442 TaxID=3365962 RepID=UPI0038018C7F
MSGLWRQVLTAYTSDQLPPGGREQLLARAAAELAHAHRAEDRPPPTAAEVQVIALEEFGLFLDTKIATAALAQRKARTR